MATLQVGATAPSTPRKTNADLQSENARLRADLEKIGERLCEEAIKYDLCEEYNDAMEIINEELSEPWLKPMTTSHSIVVRVTVNGIVNSENFLFSNDASFREWIRDALNEAISRELSSDGDAFVERVADFA